jgi:nucleotide-binding universal stress UspA family protein
MAGILFATHGGPSADGAGRVAALLAQRRGMSLRTLCVLEPLPYMDSGYETVYLPSPAEEKAMRDALRASVAEQMLRCGISGSPEVRDGPAASEIASAARVHAADVIVLGLGTHHLLDRALGHETALQLAQLAGTPVLAVPAAMASIPRRVVAAMDFSPTSIASARLCATWLVQGDALQLVHVTSTRHGGMSPELRAAAEGALAAIATQIPAPDGVTVEEIVVQGAPAAQLLDLAAARNADLIALGSHGYGIWKRLTIGSVASKVIRLSPRAVLVTPIGGLAVAPA